MTPRTLPPSETPTIEVLYFSGCPNVEPTVTILREVLRVEGFDATPISLVTVETDTDAVRLGFHGSPTVRIDGRDVVPPQGEAMPSLACRLYQSADGRMLPHPPAEAVVAALQSWRRTGG